MPTPPSIPGLWVMVLMGLLPPALPKCIFDQVQSRVRVVRAAQAVNEHGVTPLAPQQHLPVKQRSKQAEVAFKPIRITTWVVEESDSMSDTENGRLSMAVGQAVKMVSSLLSVNRAPGPLLLSRDANKYCKFLWKDPSALNFNRCGGAMASYRGETCLHTVVRLDGCDLFPEADSPRRVVLRPQGAGLPDTDFLLYLRIQTTDKCRAEPRVFAYAVHCQVDTSSRPVAGLVVICKDRLAAETYSHLATVLAMIHELFHTLGFSKDLFATWRVCSSSQG